MTAETGVRRTDFDSPSGVADAAACLRARAEGAEIGAAHGHCGLGRTILFTLSFTSFELQHNVFCTGSTLTCKQLRACCSYQPCPSGSECIHVTDFCDGYDDCGDGSDENDTFCSESFILQLFKTAPFLEHPL